MFLHLSHSLSSLRPTLHNGPGWRVSMWVQGCSLRCTKRCLNPHMLASNDKHKMSISQIMDALETIRKRQPFEGITMLGGEPSEQPQGLALLLASCHDRGWSTMVYSGNTYEALQQQPNAQGWLQHTDILVDGPYLEEEYDDYLAWRGSKNQRLLCLSDRYTQDMLDTAFKKQGKGFSIQISADGHVSASGIQNRDAAFAMEKVIRNLSS